MRIHITGASGSGVTTLGAALGERLGWPTVDADDYYWLPTEPKYVHARPPVERLGLALSTLRLSESAVFSGSCLDWGAELEDSFDFVVFLYLDTAIRIERLRQRGLARNEHVPEKFLSWAGQYDEGPPSGRSLARHRDWLSRRACPVLELSGDQTVDERLSSVLRALQGQ